MQFQYSIDISKPQTEVFSFVADKENDPLWNKVVIRSVKVNGENGVGAVYDRLYKFGFVGEKESKVTITEYDPPHRIVFTSEFDGRTGIITEAFEAIAGGTRVWRIENLQGSFLMRILAPFAIMAIRREGMKSLFKLKQLLENE